MLWAKRVKIDFGPYRQLSFFEISNRVYSDFVLIEAAQTLFKEHQIKSIRLNLSNMSGNDMIITYNDGKQIKGEAFNTAISFFQVKMRSELYKFDKTDFGVIAFNETALDEINKAYLSKKITEYPNLKFIICKL